MHNDHVVSKWLANSLTTAVVWNVSYVVHQCFTSALLCYIASLLDYGMANELTWLWPVMEKLKIELHASFRSESIGHGRV